MSKTLTVSESLFEQLATVARQRGLPGVEQLLEQWHSDEVERERRVEIVRQIDALRVRLYATHGEMPDSAALVRDDRER